MGGVTRSYTYTYQLAPPAHLHGLSLPSRLVAAYHTSVKRHSVLAMKSLYVRVRTTTYASSVWGVRACVRAYNLYAHRKRVRARARERARAAPRASISSACIRIIYSARASLTAPTVTARSSDRFSARMTVYGPLFCANFFFRFVSLRFCISVFLAHIDVRVATIATTCEFRCSQTSIRNIGVADIA